MSFVLAFDSPVGRLAITERDGAIVAIGWGGEPAGEPTALLTEARRQIEAYFCRRLDRFDLPLKPRGSAHEQRVWAAMRQIPYGETRSYSDLAFAVGSGPRAVGNACGRNPIPIVIPCHRVLAKNGLGGYSGGKGLPTKRLMLGLEGAVLPKAAGRKSGAHSATGSGMKAEYASLFRPTPSAVIVSSPTRDAD
ncbi:MAG TPA: methylated-DNA--[protein]-cysteine S-methyltransferase [Stellaceae bacterium]|nr:methylated-DNA--[protein]-cysteine S-methyltransferase [Stellaceae bacterium]